MEFWFIINGEQSGPYTLEQASDLPFRANSPAWKTGLPQWVTADQIPELADILAQRESAVAESQPIRPTREYQEYKWQQEQNTQTQVAEDAEERPSTYLVWSIIVTILCCIPFGVVAIIYSSKAGRKADMGDYKGARKAAEVAEWMIILAITLGLVWSPFSGLLTSL